nr:hypothetical protein [Chloroflexota bacterium]
MIENLFELPEESRLVAERGIGRPRLENANRQQIAMRYAALDDLLVEDHRARMVWEAVLLWYALAHNLFQVLSMRLELQTAAILQGPKEFGTYRRRCLRLLFSTIF